MSKNVIEVDDNQLEILNKALEMFVRVHLGQFEYIREDFIFHKGVTAEKLHACEDYLTQAKKVLLGFDRGASYGISNENFSVRGRIAYDMESVFKKHLAMKKDPNPSFRSSVYDDPLHMNREQELATIKNKDED